MKESFRITNKLVNSARSRKPATTTTAALVAVAHVHQAKQEIIITVAADGSRQPAVKQVKPQNQPTKEAC